MFSRLIDRSAEPRGLSVAPANPPLVASLVEMGATACTCDSLSFVTDELREQVLDGGGLFGDVQEHRHSVLRFSGHDRIEYVNIMLRGLQNG